METGDRIGEYRIEGLLGKGGSGAVYRARHQSLGRPAALKVFAPASASAQAGARFRREMKILASLQHPRIVTVYEGGEHGDRLFLSMELLEGGSLRDRLRQGSLALEEALRLGLEMAEGLEHLHERSILHRDLKPGNVMRTPDGQAKLADFGLAFEVGGTRFTAAESVVGTPAYIAPEVFGGQDFQPASDVYSFGVMLFELVAGKRPIEALDIRHFVTLVMAGQRRSLVQVMAGAPPELNQLLEECLDVEPARRPAVAAVRARLQEILGVAGGAGRRAGGAGRAGGGEPAPGREATRTGGAAVAVGLTTVGLGFGLALGAVLWRPTAAPPVTEVKTVPASPSPSVGASPPVTLPGQLVAARERWLAESAVTHPMTFSRAPLWRIDDPSFPAAVLRSLAAEKARVTSDGWIGLLVLTPEQLGLHPSITLRGIGRLPGPALSLRVDGAVLKSIPRAPGDDPAWQLPVRWDRAGPLVVLLTIVSAVMNEPVERDPLELTVVTAQEGPPELTPSLQPPLKPKQIEKIQQVESLLWQTKHQEASGTCEQWCREDPAGVVPRLYRGLARCVQAQQRRELALVKNLSAPSREILANGLGILGQEEWTPESLLARALVDAEAACRADPRDARAWSCLGRILYVSGMAGTAWACHRYATLRAPDDPSPWIHLFESYNFDLTLGRVDTERHHAARLALNLVRAMLPPSRSDRRHVLVDTGLRTLQRGLDRGNRVLADPGPGL